MWFSIIIGPCNRKAESIRNAENRRSWWDYKSIGTGFKVSETIQIEYRKLKHNGIDDRLKLRHRSKTKVLLFINWWKNAGSQFKNRLIDRFTLVFCCSTQYFFMTEYKHICGEVFCIHTTLLFSLLKSKSS